MKNRVCEQLGIQFPVIQGGMAWVADGVLAAAVSNAGGLGIIGSGAMTADLLLQQIAICRTLTNRPFGVNIMMMNPVVDELAQLVIDLKVPVITTGAGSPAKYMDAWKMANLTVMPVVASATQAKRMARIGADAIIAEGCEAGGHIGEVTTMVLTPSVVDAVDIPVIAAGGIADARGVQAAFALGAEGVQVGTRFIASTEATCHSNYKEQVVKAKDVDTVVTARSTGHPVRSLKSPLQRRLFDLEKSGASPEEMEKMALGSLRRAKVDGDIQNGSFMAGQSAALVKTILSCSDIIQTLCSGLNLTDAED